MKLLLLASLLLLTACLPIKGAPVSSPAPTATNRPTATALPPLPTPEPLPTLTPYPTYTPFPTYTPRPPAIIRETVVVTATATPTPTQTPKPTSTPTKTPVPTATPRPPIVQVMSGKGTQVLSPRVFTSSRPLEIKVEVSGTGSFSLNAVAPDATALNVMAGTAPFGGKAIYLVRDGGALDAFNIPATGITWVVTAQAGVSWKVTLTQALPPERAETPYELTGSGSGYSGVLLLQPNTPVVFRHGGFAKMSVDLIGAYSRECCESHRIFSAEDFDFGSGVLFSQRGVGDYILRVRTEPGVEWSVEVE